jgi:hypothetical protein
MSSFFDTIPTDPDEVMRNGLIALGALIAMFSSRIRR